MQAYAELFVDRLAPLPTASQNLGGGGRPGPPDPYGSYAYDTHLVLILEFPTDFLDRHSNSKLVRCTCRSN